ncbi:MAG: type II RES/Xre toxin-antitoxin system antitoxin [Terriglobia bacterium]
MRVRTGSNATRKPGRPAHFRTRGASLGLTATRTEDLISQIEKGFSFKKLDHLVAQSGLPVAQVASILGIPVRTLARRKAAGRLSPEESERLFRLSTIFEKATQLFEGDVQEAVVWLTNPKKALGNQTPLDYSRTEPGAREVENLMGRLEYGVFA